jgi:hypothetical protein
VDVKALEVALRGWSGKHFVACNIEPLKPLALAMENLSRTWTPAGSTLYVRDGVLNWFDGSQVTPKVVALAPHKDSKIQAALDKLFKFDNYVGALGLIPSTIRSMISKAVNPEKTKAGRLVEMARVARLSQVIFVNAFGMWMARKRRELAWKRREKVDGIIDRPVMKQAQHSDGSALPAPRRSSRIMERKGAADGSMHLWSRRSNTPLSGDV